jgi:hypothetical protein
MNKIKKIYRGKEFKYYSEFMSLVPALTADFLKMHPEFTNLDEFDGLPPHTTGKYKVSLLTYNKDQMPGAFPGGYVSNKTNDSKEHYPTAYTHFIEKFPDCTLAAYAVLFPHSVIRRHTGPENRTGEYVRIHLPLIVPEGDIGFEVAGEEVDWSDLFAFDNQRIHSAWNNTDQPRLCFVFDLLRTTCDLPPGYQWTWELDANTPPFPKGEMPEKDRKKTTI